MCRTTANSLFQRVTNDGFTLVGTDEPHLSRRKEILKKYPEIKELYGPDIRLLPSILAIVAVQLTLSCYAAKHIKDWGHFVFLAWSLGGTLTHWLSLGNHELSHNLCFRTTLFNELLGMVANLAQGIPSCVTFKKYHLEHHYHQGEDTTDVDVPTDWEGRVFNNSFRKIIWLILQPVFYALRPVYINPKPMTAKEVLNFVTTIGFGLLWGNHFGYKATLFNCISTLLGMGLHPVAGHFISEHYTFSKSQETYSYYGPLNYVAFNVGYHNEHHDFPKVGGFRLPEVRRIAPEYYDNLKSYNSWPGVIYDYIVRTDLSPYSRVKRFKKSVRLAAAQQQTDPASEKMAVETLPESPTGSDDESSDHSPTSVSPPLSPSGGNGFVVAKKTN